MLDRTRRPKPAVYALTAWSVEKRANGWYAYKTPFFSDPKAEELGPYGSIMSVCLMIGKKLAKEAAKRHLK